MHNSLLLHEIHIMFVSVIGFCLLLGQPNPPIRPPDLSVDEVRKALQRGGFEKSDYDYYVQLGERGFRAYEVILADPKSTALEIRIAVSILIQIKTDRSRFMALSLRRLTDTVSSNRASAAALLGQIGSERDLAPLAVILSDTDPNASRAAAYAIANIGGDRALLVLDMWLATGNHRDDKNHLRNVTEYRDELKQRMEEKKKTEQKK